MRKTTITRTTAAIFGATLLLGAAACSSDEVQDNATQATDAVESAVNDATAGNEGEGETSAEETAASQTAAEGEDGAAAETEDVAEGDVPAEITDAAGAANLGAFKSAQKAGDNMLAEYENGWVASSPDGGTHPIVGKIAETWKNDGALGNEVGLPTAGEAEIEGGWEQSFTNGTIQWTQDEGGDFSAKYV
ncbi:LGFP repeat-containing protein [Corynebacterium sp. NPDC060344]|uniref:LGFP repeat-containing protein n=1 Tax=Corynebacterium sp. NPDC060344 TaxID=3347101 RepID=UPI003664837C